jgi:hypothetical protein
MVHEPTAVRAAHRLDVLTDDAPPMAPCEPPDAELFPPFEAVVDVLVPPCAPGAEVLTWPPLLLDVPPSVTFSLLFSLLSLPQLMVRKAIDALSSRRVLIECY